MPRASDAAALAAVAAARPAPSPAAKPTARVDRARSGAARGANGAFPGGAGGNVDGNAAGGLLNGSSPSAELVTLLEQDSDQYTWIAAAIGSNVASGYQLATGDPVMAIGGFNGTDPAPTLAQFQQYVADGKVHYFISGGGFGGGGRGAGGNVSSQISSWVANNFTSQTVGGVTLYDLTSPVGS